MSNNLIGQHRSDEMDLIRGSARENARSGGRLGHK